MKVKDLQPGDEVDDILNQAWHLFVGRSSHPVYAGFQLVIWKLADGTWSFDALLPEQDVGKIHRPDDPIATLKERLNADS